MRQTTSTGGEASPAKTNESETRCRAGSMIPLPRAMQLASQNPKSVKTEKNRMRLIMENKGQVDGAEKERRINEEDDQPGTRYCDLSYNVYRCPVRKVTFLFRVYEALWSMQSNCMR